MAFNKHCLVPFISIVVFNADRNLFLIAVKYYFIFIFIFIFSIYYEMAVKIYVNIFINLFL
ncbi:hypothetical protein C0J08_18005 [Marinomonas sp. CT5]|nr:hypothetical protein C0J08_18005 [Marinomonas sp. CT5]